MAHNQRTIEAIARMATGPKRNFSKASVSLEERLRLAREVAHHLAEQARFAEDMGLCDWMPAELQAACFVH
ncbi:MAG: hypothetical protein GC138_06920 [Gammaproteobacteria bacterium]|nr:hypothetical protein [Gammaproteobacteria bacterium]